ncbi:uncharacterized protein O3C94_023419 [Discoglossus pictus]
MSRDAFLILDQIQPALISVNELLPCVNTLFTHTDMGSDLYSNRTSATCRLHYIPYVLLKRSEKFIGPCRRVLWEQISSLNTPLDLSKITVRTRHDDKHHDIPWPCQCPHVCVCVRFIALLDPV